MEMRRNWVRRGDSRQDDNRRGSHGINRRSFPEIVYDLRDIDPSATLRP